MCSTRWSVKESLRNTLRRELSLKKRAMTQIMTRHVVIGCVHSPPPLHSPPHFSRDDCLEDKNKDYQNYSVLYCVVVLCSVLLGYINIPM